MNHYNEIIKLIKFYSQHSVEVNKTDEYAILAHLIQLMGEKEFNRVFEMWFIKNPEKTFEETFYRLHKSMRQCDFFDNHYTKMDEDDPDRNKFFKGTEYKSIGGHIDMVFWHFIHISDVTEKILKAYLTELKEKV